jgi:hypothetical protein
MSAMLLYWIFQIAIWIACIVIFIRRKEIPEKHKGRKDSTVRKVLMLVFIPMFAFAYACMGGYPPKDNQVYFIFVVTGCHVWRIDRPMDSSEPTHTLMTPNQTVNNRNLTRCVAPATTSDHPRWR